jgi:uncharacterized protein (DUF2267 family)
LSTVLEGLAGVGEPFSLDGFFRRVSLREGVDLPQAIFHARMVISVLQEAISQGELDDIRSQLPPDYDRLFAPASDEQT